MRVVEAGGDHLAAGIYADGGVHPLDPLVHAHEHAAALVDSALRRAGAGRRLARA